jgi:hypothetical protein
MTFLGILRNLAVLVILTVGWLSLSPHAVAAKITCRPPGSYCTYPWQCCFRECSSQHMCLKVRIR